MSALDRGADPDLSEHPHLRLFHGYATVRKKSRLSNEPARYSDRLRLFEHYATGEGPHMPANALAARRLLQPGDAIRPPKLARLREALAGARDELG